jgi:hypothetical protein
MPRIRGMSPPASLAISRMTAGRSRLVGAVPDSARLMMAALTCGQKEPVARVALLGEAVVAVKTQRSLQFRSIRDFGDRLGEREREKVKPNLRGVAIDLVDIGQKGVDRTGPCGLIVLLEKGLEHPEMILQRPRIAALV